MSKVRWVGYLLACVVAVALLTAMVVKPVRMPRFTGLDKIAIPATVAGFRGRVVPVDAETKNALVSAEVTARQYTGANGMTIDLTMIGGTDRSALHDPRSCLVGAGWSLVGDHVEQLPGTSVPARVCHALVPPNSLSAAGAAAQSGYDVEYLYVCHRRVIASATQIRLALLESALLEQNDAPVYYVRLMAPLPADSAGQASEHAQLQQFASGLWKQVGPELIKGESS